MEAAVGQAASAPAMRPAWSRSIAGGLLAMTLGPLFGMALIVVARAAIDVIQPQPAVASDLTGPLGSIPLPGGAITGSSALACAGLIDAAVRRRVFGTIADAEISYLACVVSTVITPGLWSIFTVRPSLAWSIVAGPIFLRWRSTTPAVGIWRHGSRRALTRRRLLITACTLCWGGAALPIVAVAPSTLLPADPMLDGVLFAGRSAQGVYAIPPTPIYPNQYTEPPIRAGVAPDLSYELTVSNSGILPITLTRATATLQGHALALTGVVLARSTAPHAARPASIRLATGATAVVLVRLHPLSCGGRRREPSVTELTTVRVTYQVADGLLTHTTLVPLPQPLELICPSGTTPIGHALLMSQRA